MIEKIKKFTSDNKNFGSKEIVFEYLEFCKDLLYVEDEELFLECIEVLKKNIIFWAKEKSKIYKNLSKEIIVKEDLKIKSDWYVQDLINESTKTSTNGSTTGYPFPYLRWDSVYNKIEFENHYNLILEEFNIPEESNILYFFPQHYSSDGEFIFKTNCSGNGVVDHGINRKGFNHYVNFERFKNNQEEFFIYLFEYVKQHEIDLFYTSGPRINQLCNYIKKYNIQYKIANLLSNTNERFLPDDAYFLIENKFVDNVCDHMRCWDGGASFFTCKEKNYHLMDNLSWCEEVDTKLISTDYFSFPSPFVNYWNGDYCKIDNKYQRCDCGRLYRDFEFLENRPFSLKGMCLKDIKDKIKEMDIQGITQARCSVDSIDIISNKELSEQEKLMIRNITNKFKFNFIKEG